MSRLLRELLEADPRDFDRIILRLEHVTLRSSTDITLSTEILQKSRQKISDLGLDPKDSTYQELEQALIAKILDHDNLLRRKFKITGDITGQQGLEIIRSQVQGLVKKDKIVSITPLALKAVLKSVPPKRTLKLLKLRSIDAVIKRENPMLLYAIAINIEPKTWQKQVRARIGRLSARDVDVAAPQILLIPKSWSERIGTIDIPYLMQTIPEIGSVLLQPGLKLSTKGTVLLATATLLKSFQGLVIDSLPLRRNGMIKGYHLALPKLLNEIEHKLEPIYGIELSWRLIYQLIAEQSSSLLPDTEFVFNELNWQSVESKFTEICPEMEFWTDTQFIGVRSNNDKPISFNMIDVAVTTVLKRPFGEQVVINMQESLNNELLLRYMKHELIEKKILIQIVNEVL